jgi:tetratricopeptide (TPR) repeat protein
MKKTAPYILLALSILFIVWSLLQSSGILSTITNNLSLVNYVKKLEKNPEQFDPPPTLLNSPHVGMLAARQALRQNQTERAYDLILPLLESPDRVVMETYAEILYKKGEIFNAIIIWDTIADTHSLKSAASDLSGKGDYENKVRVFQSLQRFFPEKFTSGLAVALWENGQLVEASDLLLSSLNEYSDSTLSSEWLRFLADIYIDQHRWQDAEQVYLELINKDPKNLLALKNLGDIYMNQLNMPERAVDYFSKIVEISPGEINGYLLLAQAYENAGLIDKALQIYQRLLLISPDDSKALQNVERLSSQNKPTP